MAITNLLNSLLVGDVQGIVLALDPHIQGSITQRARASVSPNILNCNTPRGIHGVIQAPLLSLISSWTTSISQGRTQPMAFVLHWNRKVSYLPRRAATCNSIWVCSVGALCRNIRRIFAYVKQIRVVSRASIVGTVTDAISAVQNLCLVRAILFGLQMRRATHHQSF